MAIAGLLLIALSFLPSFHAIQFRQKVLQLENKGKRFAEKFRWLKEDKNTFKESLTESETDVGRLDPTDSIEELDSRYSDMPELRTGVNKTVKKYEDYIKIERELSLASIDLQTNLKELELSKDMLIIETILAFVFGIVGCSLVVFGFRNWFTKLQLPLDSVLQNKVCETCPIKNPSQKNKTEASTLNQQDEASLE